MSAPWLGGVWVPFSVLIGLVLAIALIAVLVVVRLRVIGPRRDRIAAREEANGRALLELAKEIDTLALELEVSGRSTSRQRAWSQLCRRVAVDHLECINLLMLESNERAGLTMARDRDHPPTGW